MALANELAECVTAYSVTRLDDSFRQIEKCLNLLSVEQIWHRPNDVSNAIGNLVIHLNGNVGQWILASLSGRADCRDRPAVFSQPQPRAPDDIGPPRRQTIAAAAMVIGGLPAARLVERVSVQGYDVSVAEAVIHVVEHFSLHTGQIVYATKILTNQDLSLYDAQGKRIDGRNAGTP